MIPSLSLMGLACAIASGSPSAQDAAAKLNESEIAQVEQIISSDACLPENLELILKETESKVNSGTLNVNGSVYCAAPSEICC